jgi:hypothetical protein
MTARAWPRPVEKACATEQPALGHRSAPRFGCGDLPELAAFGVCMREAARPARQDRGHQQDCGSVPSPAISLGRKAQDLLDVTATAWVDSLLHKPGSPPRDRGLK